MVDADRQWFKARVGVAQTSTARERSFCGHCINDRHPMVIEDTLSDPRFADNPLVVGEPHIRFYAGVPLLVEIPPKVLTVAGLPLIRRMRLLPVSAT